MATFTELCNDVFTLTNRPDLIAETKLAVRAATLKAHQQDFFYKDLKETGLRFAAPDYIQQIEFRSLFPQYRATKYIRKSDADRGDGPFLKLITPTQSLDRYSYDKTDIYYVAGAVIQIRSSTELEYAFFGYYANPIVAEGTYSSWVAIDHPFAIVYEAAANVYKAIGQDEQAAVFTKLVAEQNQLIKISNIEAEGV